MPSNLNLDYYYGTEADQYSFYRIPKTLLTDPRYKSVSIEAKVLYGLLLDRMGLSIKNGWMDSDGRVYIYFTQEDAMALMSCGKDKATKDSRGGISFVRAIYLATAVPDVSPASWATRSRAVNF